MVEFFRNTATAKLDRVVERHFAKKLWKIRQIQRGDHDVILVNKNNITLFIKTIDSDIQRYASVPDILDTMEKFSRDVRSISGDAICYVLTKPLLGVQEINESRRSIALFLVSDLDSLSSIDILTEDNLESLDVRTKIAVQGCGSFCISLANRAIKNNDLKLAREWVELHLDGVNKLVEAHYKLVEILIKQNDVDAARDAIKTGLRLSHFNIPLLKKLRELEKKAGRIDEIAWIDERIMSGSFIKPTFETIIEHQRLKQERSGNTQNLNRKKSSFLKNLRERFRRSERA